MNLVNQPGSGVLGVETGILDSFPDAVVVVSKQRAVVAANRSAREILAQNYLGRDLAISLRHPEVLSAVDMVLQSAEGAEVELTLPGIVPRTFNLYVTAIPPSDGVGAEAILLFRDVTAARRSEQMRADFVANVSHELRSPLSALLGFIETLKGPARNDEAARVRFLDIMQAEAERMTHLIDDLLSLSRVEINEHVQPRGRTELLPILRSIAVAVANRAGDRGARLELDAAANVPAVVGDPDELRQVFQNLIDNALKYGRPGTAVTVTLRPVPRVPQVGGAGVAVAVADQGDGIPADEIPRLTERFYRVDKGRSRSVGGTGLGLAIVKHIVSRHRGYLQIDSAQGVGSTFTVTLPSAPAIV